MVNNSLNKFLGKFVNEIFDWIFESFIFLDEKILHFFFKIETSNIVKSSPNIRRKVGEYDYSYLANFSHRNIASKLDFPKLNISFLLLLARYIDARFFIR